MNAEEIRQLLPYVKLNAPTPEKILQELINTVPLPDHYLHVLRASNGLEGAINPDEYLKMWLAEELVEDNQGYHISEFVPGCFLIGSDGGEIAYGLDLRPDHASYGYFLSRPFISIGWDEVTLLGNTFSAFIHAINNNSSSWHSHP